MVALENSPYINVIDIRVIFNYFYGFSIIMYSLILYKRISQLSKFDKIICTLALRDLTNLLVPIEHPYDEKMLIVIET